MNAHTINQRQKGREKMPVYQDKKTKKYYFSCYYTNWQGERKKKKTEGFKYSRDAKAAEREFLAQYATQPDFTFTAMYDEYMKDCKARLRPSTCATKEGLFKHAILPFFHSLKLSDITPVHVRRWQNDIIKRYEPTSQKQIHGQLSALFNFAMRFYGLKENPARLAGSIGAFKAHSAKFWTVEQFNKAMQYVAPAYLAAFSLLFYGGLRIGELLALEIRDYNPAAKTISISKSLEYINGKNYIGPTKNTQSTRIISIPASVAALIDEYMNFLYEPEPHEPLFIYFTRSQLAYRLDEAAKKAGLEKIRLHDLRHSHASMLINLGINILAISKRLGHDDIKTTLNIYGHLYHTTNEEIAGKLENLITEKGKI